MASQTLPVASCSSVRSLLRILRLQGLLSNLKKIDFEQDRICIGVGRFQILNELGRIGFGEASDALTELLEQIVFVMLDCLAV